MQDTAPPRFHNGAPPGVNTDELLAVLYPLVGCRQRLALARKAAQILYVCLGRIGTCMLLVVFVFLDQRLGFVRGVLTSGLELTLAVSQSKPSTELLRECRRGSRQCDFGNFGVMLRG